MKVLSLRKISTNWSFASYAFHLNLESEHAAKNFTVGLSICFFYTREKTYKCSYFLRIYRKCYPYYYDISNVFVVVS